MTTHLAYEEETLWRNLHARQWSVPFIECGDVLTCVRCGTGPCDGRTLQDAVAEIVRRHAVLQSRFRGDGEQTVRRSLRMPRNPVRRFDLRDLPEDERQRHAADIAYTKLCEPFDVASGPLFRVAWMTLDREQHVLAFAAHHLVFDMPSAQIVARELEACLAAQPIAVRPQTAPYSDYVRWQRQQLTGATLARLRTFWLQKLDGLIDRRVATAKPQNTPSTRSTLVRFTIDADEDVALRRLSRRCRVSLATTMLGLLTVVVREITDSPDVVIGVPVSARPANGFENTVGLFVNVVPVRTDLSQTSDFAALLGRLWSAVLEAYQHRAFPYECLVDALGARTGHGPPPFRVVFNFSTPSTFELVSPDFPGRDTSPRHVPSSFADISLHTRDTGTSLECCVLYKSDLFHESEMTDVTTRFRRLAREVARDPDRAVSASRPFVAAPPAQAPSPRHRSRDPHSIGEGQMVNP